MSDHRAGAPDTASRSFLARELLGEPLAVPYAFHNFPIQRSRFSVGGPNFRMAVLAPIKFSEPGDVKDFLDRFSAHQTTMAHDRRLTSLVAT
jgi:hypothetical protein